MKILTLTNLSHVWDAIKAKFATKEEVADKVDKVERVTILDGESLANQNVKTVLALIKRIKEQFPKAIWLYSGFYLNKIITDLIRLEIVIFCDVL